MEHRLPEISVVFKASAVESSFWLLSGARGKLQISWAMTHVLKNAMTIVSTDVQREPLAAKVVSQFAYLVCKFGDNAVQIDCLPHTHC